MVVGRITNKAIGLTGKKPIAYTMSGNFVLDGCTFSMETCSMEMLLQARGLLQ